MTDQQIRINVQGTGIDKAARDMGAAAKAADGLADGLADVAKQAQAANRAAAAANLDRMRAALGGGVSDVDLAMAAARFNDIHQLRRWGGLPNYLSGPAATYRDQTAYGRAQRDRALRSLGLPPPGGGGGSGGDRFGWAGAGGLARSAGGMVMRGGMFGLGLLGIGSLSSMLSSGFKSANEENLSLDTAIRSAGALGMSLSNLRGITERLAGEFSYLRTDTAKYAQSWAQVTGGLGGVGPGLGSALGIARAFGIDPSTTIGLFGVASRTGADHGNSKRFAADIAEAISRSGMPGMAGAFAQAMSAFADRTAALNVGRPDMMGFGGMLSRMMSGAGGALTPGSAAQILGAADATIRAGGAGGTFGQASLMQALLSAGGSRNPFLLRAIEEGGLFASPQSALGPGSQLGRMLRGFGVNLGSLGGGTNLDAVMQQFQRLGPGLGAGAGAWLGGRLGLNQQQAATLYNAWRSHPGATNDMLGRLQALGINLSDVKESGFGEMAAILGVSPGDMGTLRGYGSQFLRGGQLGTEERRQLSDAMGGNDFSRLRDILFGDAARHGQVSSEATDIRDMLTTVKNIDNTLGQDIAKAVDGIYGILSGRGIVENVSNPNAPWRSIGRFLKGGPFNADSMDSYFSSFGSLGDMAKVIAFNESSLNPNAQNGNAAGLFQFMPGTWSRYGGRDPYSTADQRTVFQREYADFLSRGGDPTKPEQFLMFHHQGPGHMFDAPDKLVQHEMAQLRSGDLNVHVTVTTSDGKVVGSKVTPVPRAGASYSPAGAPVAN